MASALFHCLPSLKREGRMMKFSIPTCLKHCLVTHIQSRSLSEYSAFLTAAIRGGVTSVQLREKHNSPDLKATAIVLRKLLRPLHVPLIINDFVELAIEIDADGVHLGQQD